MISNLSEVNLRDGLFLRGVLPRFQELTCSGKIVNDQVCSVDASDNSLDIMCFSYEGISKHHALIKP